MAFEWWPPATKLMVENFPANRFLSVGRAADLLPRPPELGVDVEMLNER